MTMELHDLHPDVASLEKLTFNLVIGEWSGKGNPRASERQVASLNASLTQVVAMWEQSGQGDGGQICDDEEEEENENKESPCNLPVPGLLVHDRSHGVLYHQSAFVANN